MLGLLKETRLCPSSRVLRRLPDRRCSQTNTAVTNRFSKAHFATASRLRSICNNPDHLQHALLGLLSFGLNHLFANIQPAW